jgi:predicted NBD/HSP70 family sugar kinase
MAQLPSDRYAASEEHSLPRVSGDVRRHNLGLILEHLVANGPSARSTIAIGTGLSRGAVTALVVALLDAGVVRESESVASVGKGRPRTLLSLAADSVALVAAQLDADRATGVAVDLAGNELARFSEQHGRPRGDPDAVLDVLGGVVEQVLTSVTSLGRRVASLTVVAFAPVGGDPEIVLADTDLGWGPVDVLAGLRRRVRSLPPGARLVADVRVAALAERRRRPELDDLIYVKSDSGIGGAIISGGVLIDGAHGYAGAIGHVAVDRGGALCECGQHGCLVTVAGPDVLLERAGLGDMLRDSGLTEALAEFQSRIASGEPRATAAWDEGARWIGHTLNLMSLTTDPARIVLGGYWASLAESISHEFGQHRPDVAARLEPDTVVEGSTLGHEAALLGALWSDRDRLLADALEKIGTASR